MKFLQISALVQFLPQGLALGGPKMITWVKFVKGDLKACARDIEQYVLPAEIDNEEVNELDSTDLSILKSKKKRIQLAEKQRRMNL